jgi:tRNA threonylcarbamoyladenosine biosynthesis protein TsaB
VLVLAVETATESAGVALVDEGGLLAMAVTARRRRHAETVAPSIEFVCARAGVTLADVAVLAVDVGPGLFTGLRVGIATVKALALALDVPVVEAGSLEVLAHAGAGHWPSGPAGPDRPDDAGAGTAGRPGLVVPVVDARRGEVFSAVYETGRGEPRQVGADAVGTPEDLADTVRALGRRCLMAGDGALRYGALFATVPGVTLATEELAHPPVAVLGALARSRAAVGAVIAGDDVAARYRRDADVRIHWEQRSERPTVTSAPASGER